MEQGHQAREEVLAEIIRGRVEIVFVLTAENGCRINEEFRAVQLIVLNAALI